MPIRMIASDLDDSLLNGQSLLTQRTLKALERAMAAGAKVVLASGRMVETMRGYAHQARVNAPIIAYNGALIYDLAAEKPVYERLVAPEDARAAIELAREKGVYIQAFVDGEYIFEEKNAWNERYEQLVGYPGRALHAPIEGALGRGAYKLLLIDAPERIAQVRPEFQRVFAGRLECATSRPFYLEITAAGVDKRGALRALSDLLAIPPEEIAAFGDGQNDVAMLKFAGRGYALANARPEVLAQAPYAAPANDEDGVAQIVEAMLDAGEIEGR